MRVTNEATGEGVDQVGLVDRWWRKTVRFPVPGTPYRDESVRALLVSMRRTIRAMTAGALLAVLMIGLMIAGWNVPSYSPYLICVAAVVVSGGIAPSTVLSAYAMYRAVGDDEWMSNWVDRAQVHSSDLWFMLRPPVPYDTYMRYVEALNTLSEVPLFTRARSDSQVFLSPGMVWWLVVHDVPVESIERYRQAGLRADEVPVAISHGLTPAFCEKLWSLGCARVFTSFSVLLAFVHWVRGTQLDTDDESALLQTIDGWVRLATESVVGADRTRFIKLLRHMETSDTGKVYGFDKSQVQMNPCWLCPGEGQAAFHGYFDNMKVDGASTRAWVEQVGQVAPWAMWAGFSFADVEAAAKGGAEMTVEGCQVMRALTE